MQETEPEPWGMRDEAPESEPPLPQRYSLDVDRIASSSALASFIGTQAGDVERSTRDVLTFKLYTFTYVGAPAPFSRTPGEVAH